MYTRTLQKVVELSGMKDASQYFQMLPPDFQVPQAPPKPTPEEVLAQVQAESIQADIQKKAAELELQRQKMMRDDDFRRDQMAQDYLLKKYELELKYGTQISNAELAAVQNLDREAMRQQTAMVQSAMQAAQAPQMPVPINRNGSMSDEEAVRKGRKAQQVLEDETLVAALTKLENDQLWVFKSTRADETAKREQCWAMLRAIENLKTELTKVIDNGKVAQRAIERVQKQ
jgi:hypothetical protein